MLKNTQNIVKSVFSILVFFVIFSSIMIIPTAFADHPTASVSAPAGTSVPGCEETNECYIPYEVTVDVGGEVTWTNDDSAAHTVTAGNAADGLSGEFDSGLFMAGATFTHKFESVGTYDYFCMVHPWMEGVVIVQEAEAEEMKEETMMKTMIGSVDVTMSPPIEGSSDAPVTIIEFGDFQCPKCEQWFKDEKSTIKSEFIDTDKANLYFVDFAFLGDDSFAAAEASYCADEQGMYWEYHSRLYNNQGGINDGWANSNSLKQFASDLNLDTDKFNECLDSGKYTDRVTYNTRVGASNVVEGTPAFLIIGPDGTKRIDGPQPSSVFADSISSMIGEAQAQEMDSDDTEVVDTTENEEGGGCLIATAAYGTELAPQVQFLREIRDGKVMSTESGASFMTGFNQLYYSFSPTIADMERENPLFQEMVRAFITPMISTLSIMTFAEEGSESSVLGLGISVIALNLGMYVAAPAIVGFAVNRSLKSRKNKL